MSIFAVRLVLRDGATWAAYNQLHDKMEASYFYRKIFSEGRVWYNLPAGEYQFEGGGSRLTVARLAAQIAQEIDPSIRALATEGPSAWVGLDVSAYQGGPTVKAPFAPFPAPDYQPRLGASFAALLDPPSYLL